MYGHGSRESVVSCDTGYSRQRSIGRFDVRLSVDRLLHRQCIAENTQRIVDKHHNHETTSQPLIVWYSFSARITERRVGRVLILGGWNLIRDRGSEKILVCVPTWVQLVPILRLFSYF